jgi:hypothetical protein
MTFGGDGIELYAVLLLIAVLAHEPWRWAGYALGRWLNPDDEIFKWVKSVSTALVAAMVARLVLFPAGSLASVPLEIRLGAFVVGLAVFYASAQTPWKGVVAGALVIAAGKFIGG